MSVERLIAAEDTGEIVEIVYFGGNQPGTRREVTVRDVVDGYLEARCLATDMPKTFRLDLVEVWDGDASVPRYDPGRGREAARAKRAAPRKKRTAKQASDRMIRGMSGGPVPPLVAADAPASHRMIEGMSAPVSAEVDTNWITRDAIRSMEHDAAPAPPRRSRAMQVLTVIAAIYAIGLLVRVVRRALWP